MVSANLDLVRSIYADWERGDYTSADWADPEIELIIPDGPSSGSWTGVARMREVWREWLRAWNEYRSQASEYRQLDEERVLVLIHGVGRGKTSGAEVAMRGANLFHVRDGKVTRLVLYPDRDYALADLGLEPEAD